MSADSIRQLFRELAPGRLSPRLLLSRLATGHEDVAGTALHLEQDNWIHAQGAKAIAESSTLSSLHTLVLGLNQIGDEGANYLAESKNLSKLAFLNVIGNKLTAAGEDALRYSKSLQQLKTLELV